MRGPWGTRPLLQHAFGPESIPLEKVERTGVAGNVPDEWKATCMVTNDGQLYLNARNIFASIRDGAKHVKRGRGSVQPLVVATLEVDSPILIDRFLKGEPSRDPTQPVYLDVCGVTNPGTKQRNVRYRLACSPGWGCVFTIMFDRKVVSREEMQTAVRDAGILVGVGDGRKVGAGRFEILQFEELTDADSTTAEGSVERPAPDHLASGQEAMQPVGVPGAADANGSAHRPPPKRKARH